MNGLNLNSLNTFLTERLLTVAGEIFEVFKDAFSDYQCEIERIKQENRCLKDSLAEIYNNVEERTEKHTNQKALIPGISHIQVNLELETSPKKSDPQTSPRHQHTFLCESKFSHLDEDQDPELSFLHKFATEDKNYALTHLPISSSNTIKLEPSASPTDDSAQVKQEAEMNHVINDQQVPLSCTYCNQTFFEIPELVAHTQRHLALFTCELCGKSFSQKKTLTRHMSVHKKERPFGCGCCKKRFKMKWHLTEHERTHSGEKPFCCSVCKKRFTRSSALNNHLRNHCLVHSELMLENIDMDSS